MEHCILLDASNEGAKENAMEFRICRKLAMRYHLQKYRDGRKQKSRCSVAEKEKRTCFYPVKEQARPCCDAGP